MESTRGQAESLSPRAPSPRCRWNSPSSISSSTRHPCCMFRGASRRTRETVPHWRSRSPAKLTSAMSFAQVTPQRPISGAAEVTMPGPTRFSDGTRGHTRRPFTRSPGRTSERVLSGEKSDASASTTLRFARTSQRCTLSPCPVATQSEKSPSSFAGRTAPRRRSRSSPLSSTTRTRPPRKADTTPRCVSGARSDSRISSSSSSSTVASTVSPTRRLVASRTAREGSTATTCHVPARASAETDAHAAVSSKSDVRQPPRSAVPACMGEACHCIRCASSHRFGPAPNSTSGRSFSPAPFAPGRALPARSSRSPSFLFASWAAASPVFSQEPRLLCWNLSFFSARRLRSHSGTGTRGHGFAMFWYEAVMQMSFWNTAQRRSL
mmetsp:Transcript_2552/g.7176  ORF Transcript_2552/g.7176 Transcript_2552/m.7176 type:complete len:380 (+) Transcript_2552:3100-4239(+)